MAEGDRIDVSELVSIVAGTVLVWWGHVAAIWNTSTCYRPTPMGPLTGYWCVTGSAPIVSLVIVTLVAVAGYLFARGQLRLIEPTLNQEAKLLIAALSVLFVSVSILVLPALLLGVEH